MIIPCRNFKTCREMCERESNLKSPICFNCKMDKARLNARQRTKKPPRNDLNPTGIQKGVKHRYELQTKNRDWGKNYCKICDCFEKDHKCPKLDIATGDWSIL